MTKPWGSFQHLVLDKSRNKKKADFADKITDLER